MSMALRRRGIESGKPKDFSLDAPEISSVGTYVNLSSNVSNPGVPSGVVDGSLVVAIVSAIYTANITVTTGTITVPTGWTRSYAASVWSPSDGITIATWFCDKYASSEDSGTYSFTANAIGGNSAIAIDGQAMIVTGGPGFGEAWSDSFLSTGNASSASSISHASTTPGGDYSLLIAKVAADVSGGINLPSGWAEFGDGGHSYLRQSASEATGTMVWGFDTPPALAALLVIGTIRPA